MTSAASTRDVADPSAANPGYTSTLIVHPVTLRRVIVSEWIKLRSLRSSWLVLGLVVVGTIGIAVVGGILTQQDWTHMRPQRRANFSPIDEALTGVLFAQLALGVLGVLFVSAEYGTGSIRSTLAAVPRRWPVLAAKLLVFGTVTLVLSAVTAFLTTLFGQAALGSHGVSLSAPGALRATLGAGLYLAVVALLGVAIGGILRSTAGGIGTLVGLLLVLPGIVSILPDSWQQHLNPYLPSAAGGAVYQIRVDPGTLAPWTGLGVFCLWAAAAIVAAFLVLRRRDA